MISSALIITSGFEGYSEVAYQDSGGTWTVCYGETRGVMPDTTKTPEECNILLESRLKTMSNSLLTLPYNTPDVTLLGSLDFIYNIGETRFLKSTVYKHLKQGRYKEAGESVLLWKYIKGVDCSIKSNGCYGIWKRRLWESYSIGNWYNDIQSACRASKHYLGLSSDKILEYCKSL